MVTTGDPSIFCNLQTSIRPPQSSNASGHCGWPEGGRWLDDFKVEGLMIAVTCNGAKKKIILDTKNGTECPKEIRGIDRDRSKWWSTDPESRFLITNTPSRPLSTTLSLCPILRFWVFKCIYIYIYCSPRFHAPNWAKHRFQTERFQTDVLFSLVGCFWSPGPGFPAPPQIPSDS